MTVFKDMEHYWLCEICASERGGVFPAGHVCTVMKGTCPYCGDEDTLIPWVDFDWPKDEQKTKTARSARD